MNIAQDLYFYPWESMTQNNCNSILITGEVNALIDPGHEALYPHLVKKAADDGQDLANIGLIINTHSHPDHFEASISAAKGEALVALHREGEDYLKKSAPMFYAAAGGKAPDFKIDMHLTEGELDVGDKKLVIYHTPGHSPGSICIYWPENKVLIAGDLIFAQGVGRTDFPGGSGQLLKESIERMAELDIELVLPGHGPPVVGAEDVKRNFEMIRQMYFSLL